MKAHEQIIASLAFFTRLDFFSRLPGLAFKSTPISQLSQLSWTFPITGAIIGTISGTLYTLLHHTGLSPSLAAIITIASQIALTGALHEDGLADTTDGFFGGNEKLARLSIMRDSRIGSFGALALLFSFFLRTSALAQLATPHSVLIACIVAGAMSRATIPVGMFMLPHARMDGLAAWAGKPTLHHVWASLGLAGIITAALMGVTGIGIFIVALLACGSVCLFSQRKISGITGDVYGTIQQIVEMTILTVATLALHA